MVRRIEQVKMDGNHSLCDRTMLLIAKVVEMNMHSPSDAKSVSENLFQSFHNITQPS